jgi:hypothetical protein
VVPEDDELAPVATTTTRSPPMSKCALLAEGQRRCFDGNITISILGASPKPTVVGSKPSVGNSYLRSLTYPYVRISSPRNSDHNV